MDAINEAQKRGADAGKSRAEWVFEAETDIETYRAFLAGVENNEWLETATYDVAPDLREWANKSMAELLGGDDPEIEEAILTAYEDAFSDAYWTELQRIAKHQVEREQASND